MKFQPSRLSIRRPRKKVVIIIAAIIVVAGLITYGVFSYLHWQQYDKESKSAPSYLKSNIDTSFKTDMAPTDQAFELDKIVTRFEYTYGKNPCEVSVWYSWQTILPQLKAMRTNCDDRFADTLKVRDEIKTLSQFFKDEKKTAELIATTIEVTKAEKDYAKAGKMWKLLADSNDISKRDNFKKIHDETVDTSTAISDAYTALANAISKENKAEFDTAVSALGTAYAKLDGLKITAAETQTEVIKTFISAYEKL